MHLNDQATQPLNKAYRKIKPRIEPSEDAIREGYRLIPLTRGMVAVVDESDYEFLSQWNWYANPNTVDGAIVWYARRDEWLPGDKKRVVFMHRVIMGDPVGMLVDHADNDGLNCRRYNLRVATKRQNNQNSRSKANSQGIKGVRFDKLRGTFRAKIKVNGREILLGRHKTAEAAAEAYRLAAIKYFGEFACFKVIVSGDTIGKGQQSPIQPILK